MTKEEFLELGGYSYIEDDVYAKLEAVYTHIDRWNNSKKDFVDFFQNNGMDAIEMLYAVVQKGLEKRKMILQLQKEINELKILNGYAE